MKEISKGEYLVALNIVRAYELQQEVKRLYPFSNCTENDIISNECTHYNSKAIAYWVVKPGEDKENDVIGVRDADAIIQIRDHDFVTIEGGRIVYGSVEEAYKAVVKMFKRKKLIK